MYKEPYKVPIAYFLTMHYYSLEALTREYQEQIHSFRNDTWNAPVRAAKLSAAVKRYKTSQMLQYIMQIAKKDNVELTPTIVKKLCRKFFKRQGTQDIIVDTFGDKDRTEKVKDSQKKTDELIKKYFLAARKFWSDTEAEIEKVKAGYRNEIKKLKKEKEKAE